MTIRPFPGFQRRGVSPFERDVELILSNLLRGKFNATLDVTLAASASSTIIKDERFSEQCAVEFDPLTQNAAIEKAAGTLWVSARTEGQITIEHSNDITTDRTFRLVIIG